jgi:hypothetical protein
MRHGKVLTIYKMLRVVAHKIIKIEPANEENLC